MTDMVRRYASGANVEKASRVLVSLLFIFLFVQSILMGLNREHGNDLDLFLKCSSLFFEKGAFGGYACNDFGTAFPVFVFQLLGYVPAWLAHSLWYVAGMGLFIFGLMRVQEKVMGTGFRWSALVLVMFPLLEILQFNTLNAQMNLPVVACFFAFLLKDRFLA